MKLASDKYAILFAFFVFISCVISFLTFGVGPGPLELDAGHYWELAGETGRGDWLQFHNRIDYRSPGYPAALGVYRNLFGSHALMAVVISQHGLVVLVDLLVALIGWRVTGSRVAGLVSFGIAATSLMRPWFANLICPEPLFMFLLTAALGVLCEYHRRPGLFKSVAFGTLLGLSILVRPVPKLLWIPLLGLFCLHCTNWVSTKRSARVIVGHALAAAAVLTLVLSPWLARNWVLFGKPFVARLPAVNKWQVCFQGGSAARLPIPDSASGRRLLSLLGTRDGDVAERYCAAVVATLEKKGLAHDEIDQLISQACREAIAAKPAIFAWLTFKRFVNFWRCTADGIPYYDFPHPPRYGGQRTWEFGQLASRYRSLLRNAPVHWLWWNEVATALCGAGTCLLIVRRPTRVIGASLACIFLYFAAVTSVVEVENYKYRVFLEPFMIIATVAGIWSGLETWKASSDPSGRSRALDDTVPYGIPIQHQVAEADGSAIEQRQRSGTESELRSLVPTGHEEGPIAHVAQPDQHVDTAGRRA